MTRRSADATTASSGSRSSASRRASKSAATSRTRAPSRSAKRSASKASLIEVPTPPPADVVDPPRRRSRAKRGQGDQLREQILDAAYEILVETGNADRVSTRAVARRVGCSSPALYLHFPDRAGLLWEVCNRQFVRLGELIRAAVADHDDPIEALHAAARAYITFGVEHAQEYRVMMMGPETVPWDAAIDELPYESGFDVLHALIDQAMGDGVLRQDDPTMVAITVWSAVHGVVALRIAKPSFPWPPLDDDIDRTIALITHGLAPPTEPTATVATSGRVARRGSAPRAAKSVG